MKNHFIPCFYTKRWTTCDGRLVRYTRPFRSIVDRRKFPSEVGFEVDLYTLPGVEDETKDFLETKFFRDIDQKANDVLNKMEADGALSLDPSERQAWTTFLISLRQRNREKLEDIARRAESIFREQESDFRLEFERRKTPGEKQTFDEFVADLRAGNWFDQRHKLLVQQAVLVPDSTRRIMSFHWSVLTFQSCDHELLTSDRPLIMTDGIGHADGHLALPIGPRKLFVAVNNPDAIKSAAADPRLIAQSNEAVVRQAKKEVFAANLRQLRFVENRFRRH